ncbi:hypothetical protein F442_10714 [Phytophthora nicotianae P10297]|uniref:Ankyrin repeat-containing domain n=1 Tax=Phytophthora nicotianae P10297 TaxID=1317064 RepID=W2Z4S8_PHYNI|nr:hypothetical protein F442_10714 [Phytophthora nicotianae P10297]
MSVDMAMLEAAATGQVEWLQVLIPQFGGEIDDVAYKLTNSAAEYGHSEVIKLVAEWWEYHAETGDEDFTTFDPLKRAVERGHDDIVEVLCKEMNPRFLLPRAAECCEVEVIKQIFRHHGRTQIWDELGDAMLVVGSNGKYEITKFLNESCGEELYRRTLDCPLTRAIECGQIELVKYLYTNGRKATSFEEAFSAAVSYRPSEVVDLLSSDGRCNAELINKGFVLAAGAGQLAIMKLLQLKRECDESTLAEAFKNAAGCGQLEVIEQLPSEGYQISSSTFEEAATVAGGGGHFSVLKLLDGKKMSWRLKSF